MIELKLCPFCGGRAEMYDGITFRSQRQYEPRCVKCECAIGLYDTEEQAAEAWNRRADDDTHRDI